MKIFSFIICFVAFMNILPGYTQSESHYNTPPPCLKKEELKDDFVMLGSTNATQKVINTCPRAVTITYVWNGDFLDHASEIDKEPRMVFIGSGESDKMSAWEIKPGSGSFHFSILDFESDRNANQGTSSSTDADFSEFLEDMSDDSSFFDEEQDATEELEYISNEINYQSEKISVETNKTEEIRKYDKMESTKQETFDKHSDASSPKYSSASCNDLVRDYRSFLSSYSQFMKNIQNNPSAIDMKTLDSFQKRIEQLANRESNNQISEECVEQIDKLLENFANNMINMSKNFNVDYDNSNSNSSTTTNRSRSNTTITHDYSNNKYTNNNSRELFLKRTMQKGGSVKKGTGKGVIQE